MTATAPMPVPVENRWHCASTETLQLTVMPTEQCNFRCTYCFESFSKGRMSEEVVLGLERLLTARAGGLQNLSLSWYGGEPLLARDIVLRVMRHVAVLKGRHPRLRMAADMITNAWHLERDLFADLVQLGVTTYMVSFDGPPELHDQKRKRKHGGPTFDRIWSNLESLRSVTGDFDVRVRLHLDRDNDGCLPDFFARFAASFAGDSRFRLMLRELSRLGGRGDHALHTLDADADAMVAEAKAEAGRLELPQYDATADAAICHASRLNSFVLRSDGSLSKCSVALDRPENNVGRLCGDGSLQLDGERLRPWLRGLLSADPMELACPVQGFLDR